MPHLLWHGPVLYNGHLWEPVTLISTAKHLAVELSLPNINNLGLSWPGIEPWSSACEGKALPRRLTFWPYIDTDKHHCVWLILLDFKDQTCILISLVIYSFSPWFFQIIGARHLVKSGKGIISPFVEIEITGLDYDKSKFKTTTISKEFSL